MISTWTPEREERARRMWNAGQSAAAIAKDLGGVTRVAVIGKIHRMGIAGSNRQTVSAKPKAKPKGKARPVRVCAVPGCGEVLGPKNAMGVCLTHKHAARLCQCPACQGQLVAHRADPIDRPGVRSAVVPRTGTSTSGGEATVRVSLPREPWPHDRPNHLKGTP
ncbi:MAG: GcrA family cell cycle regulator [Pseudomonadota bacterium]